MEPLSENSPVARRMSAAVAALEVFEGLVLDGVFVPQVAVLRMLWLARRANDKSILHRSLNLTAAVGILAKERQIADALDVYARSGDVVGFIAAEQDVLQVRRRTRERNRESQVRCATAWRFSWRAPFRKTHDFGTLQRTFSRYRRFSVIGA